MFNRNKGAALAFTMLIIMVLMIFTGALVTMLRQETRWELKQRRSSIAFHLAEAAVDRGYWKLTESKEVWDSVAEGTFDVKYVGGEFADIEGGTYKITITTTSDKNERKIVGVGQDSSTKELRAIEVIVKHVAVESAIFSPTLRVGNNVSVHWGPIYSTAKLYPNTSDSFPRKYAVDDIIGYGPPDTDDTEYWEYYPVQEPPGIDFQYYLDNADEYYGPPIMGHPKWETPTGGVPYEFNKSNHPAADHDDPDDVKIYYVAGNCTFQKIYLRGTMIIAGGPGIPGNLDLKSNGMGAYIAHVPENAWQEYAKFDTEATGQYPADIGLKQSSTTYVMGGAGNKISFEGFIYVAGNWTGTGNQDFHGCVQCQGSMAGLGGGVAVYYDDQITEQVVTTDLNIKRVSWKSIKPSW